MQFNYRPITTKQKCKSRAFTLLEVIIATGILGCSLIALLTSVHQSHKMNQKAVILLEQSLLAKTKIKEILLIEDLSASSSGSGKFEDSRFCSYSFTTSYFVLPFSDSADSEKDNILEVILTLKDERTPNSDYKITTYTFGKKK